MKTKCIAVVALLSASLCLGDATVAQKTQFHLAGPIGGLVNVFSRTAREGVTATTTLHGNKKLTRTGDSGELIDLDQEKIYMIDFARQTYSVKTFDELRREWEKAQEDAKKQEAKQSKSSKDEGPEYEVDVDVKSTGKKETVNGYDTHQEIVTITVHEKGKAIEKSGGWVLTSDIAMGPKIAAMKELTDFDLRFVKKLYGPSFATDMRGLAAAFAATPAFAKAMKTFSEKRTSFEGTPIRTNMRFEAVAGSDQPKEQAKNEEKEEPASAAAAALGGLMNRMKKRNQEKSGETSQPAQPGRTEMFTSTTELVSANASAADVSLPASFKQR